MIFMNSVESTEIERLDKIIKMAAQIITATKTYEHITPAQVKMKIGRFVIHQNLSFCTTVEGKETAASIKKQ
jgi:hypothetical protein